MLLKLSELENAKFKKKEKRRKYTKVLKIEKPKILVIGNVIRKAHTKFHEASSILNTKKSMETIQ